MYANILKMSAPVLLAVAFLVGTNLPAYAQGQTKKEKGRVEQPRKQDGKYAILFNIVSQILRLQPLR